MALPGIGQFYPQEAEAPPIAITVFATKYGEDVSSITYPTGIQAGDIIAINNKGYHTTTPSDKIPTGFTGVGGGSSGDSRYRTSVRLADGTESGSISLISTSGYRSVILLVFRCSPPVVSMNIKGNVQQLTNSNPAGITVTSGSSTGQGTIVVANYGVQAGLVVPRYFSPTPDGEVNDKGNTSNRPCFMAWKLFNGGDPLSDVFIDMDDEGAANFINGYYLELFTS